MIDHNQALDAAIVAAGLDPNNPLVRKAWQAGIAKYTEVRTEDAVAWRYRMANWGENYWHYFTKEPRHKEEGEIWQPLFIVPSAGGETVKVKPLEWDAPDSWNIAKSVVGTYVVRPCLATNYRGQFVMRCGDEEKSSLYPSEEAAKNAAQADYERRIRSALTSSETDKEKGR